ncbi:hypothetical protein F3Y22_tig00111027pilonHSYRG00723 [Hibiscus syriacus]|uniref:SWIM-type domain-containing protein n=1 Tax=Hibiscus syriacus TaxID=106335 RepID=A0A6A2Z7B4_HIBSY|nr:hypothetical protein F3Y22_tig00111027pilonHSYRG00723 [Hibiscus syriacus]
MDNNDVDNVKPTEECHEVHNVDESDRLVGQLFCSRDQAWYIYKGFAREHGFSARKGTTRLDVEGNVKTQDFCCSKEGFRVSKVNIVDRQRAHTPVTRTGCKARVVVTATNTNDQWVISKSDQKHNHALCTPAMTPFMRSNRAVSKADIDEATTLKEVGVGSSQVMNYLTQQAGGYHNVGFTHKDLYNALQRGKAKEIVDGDVNTLIAYFDYKKHDDPGFFMTYSIDESGALYNLIWSDSTSRSDYTCFGDVIAFDTTYKDNLYGRPIMPIVGVNHHHNTIVFATAIIADDTSQSFEWVLQNFLEAMMNKSPISVVTDGDRAMHRAIKSVIPYAKHILCSWHLSRNAQANIGDPKFTAAFSKCMASWWTTKEFDIQWRSVVSEFNVQKHPWVIEKGNTRHLWAQAYLTGHFFANIRSTQRCESMNASLAIALKHKKTYLDVVRAIEDEISRMRMNELKSDYLSSHTKPFQITKLVDLESHAAAIFTRESFRVFQDELIRETLYRIEAEIKSLSDECQHYILSKYAEKNRKFEINFDSRTKTLICSCKKFETVGLPCRHQLHILKHLDYTYLPGTLIQSRWTNDAKASAPSFVDLNVSPEVMQMARFAALRSTSSRLCYIASKTDESFKTARDEMKKLIEELENSFALNDSVNQSIVVNNVCDPQRKQRKRKEVPKNKVEKKIRGCGYCNGEGHNKLTCPQVKLSLSTSTQPTSTDFFEDGME